MVTFADTSFLFSLYGSDPNTPKAVAWISRHRNPIMITAFGRYELANAVRFAEFKGTVAPGKASVFWSEFESDLTSGRIVPQTCNLAEVIDEATRISEKHTVARGHRSFDILHVAAAVVLRGEFFLSFDVNQRRLAVAEGLKCPV